MPRAKVLPFGVWEDGDFIGAVLFGSGATPNLARPFGLKQRRVCELTRIALREHKTPVSRIMRFALKKLRQHCPGIELIVSFADSAQGHVGGIYQGMNWVYVGAQEYHAYRIHGVLRHPRSLHASYGPGAQSIEWLRRHLDPNAERVTTPAKYKYCLPLSDTARELLAPMSLPYPKAVRVTSALLTTA